MSGVFEKLRRDHRITHQLRPINMNGRSILSVMSIQTSPTKIRARLFSTLNHSRIRIYDYFPLDIARTQLYTET